MTVAMSQLSKLHRKTVRQGGSYNEKAREPHLQLDRFCFLMKTKRSAVSIISYSICVAPIAAASNGIGWRSLWSAT